VIGRFPWDPFPPGEPPPKGDDPLLAAVYRGAVEGADAYRGVRAALRRESGTLRVGNRFVPDGRYREVAFVALGHAAGSMALAVLDVFGDRVTQGFVAGPARPAADLPFRSEVVEDGWGGADAAPRVLDAAREIAAGLRASDLLLLLLSPGALRALLVAPAGVDRRGFEELLRSLHEQGTPGAAVAEVARVIGAGGVGGQLLPGGTRADLQCFLVDRGDGPLAVGGGPMFPVTEAERRRVHDTLERAGALGRLPRNVWEPSSDRLPASERRPVVVAAPSDGLRSAADVAVDKGWSARAGALGLPGGPAEAAERFVARVEEVLAAERLEPGGHSKGFVVFATLTLELPEGVAEREACEAFLARARGTIRRREMSLGLFRTSGPTGPGPDFSGGAVGAPGEGTGTSRVEAARPIRVPAGITDVGLVAAAVVPTTPGGAAGGVRPNRGAPA